MNKNYLPSKAFIKKVLLILGLLLVVFVVTNFNTSIQDKISGKNSLKELSVREFVTQDSNSNGIQDWEETLWGLDPNENGPENKEYITSRKADLATKNESKSTPNEELTESDKLAREFLALVVSLQQSGNLNEDAISALSESVSSRITANPIQDIYSKNNLKMQGTTTITLNAYKNSFEKLAQKYSTSDIGEELTYIGQALATNDEQSLQIAVSIASEYRSFGKELMQMTVPTSLADVHTSLANNYEKNAKALEKMNNMLKDNISGMSALVEYNRYNNAIIENLSTIKDFFIKNGTI